MTQKCLIGEGHISRLLFGFGTGTKPVFLVPPFFLSEWQKAQKYVCMPRDGSKYSAGWAGRWFPHECNWCLPSFTSPPSSGKGRPWLCCPPATGPPVLLTEGHRHMSPGRLALHSAAKMCRSNNHDLASLLFRTEQSN